jgi:predicted RND superfamily exporter protein
LKSLVSGLSAAVRRFPWIVVIVTVIVSVVLGGLSQNFTPEEDSNASFAPDAPELTAAESIGDLFGSDSTVAVMQVIITTDDGNIFSLDGLDTINAISETVGSGTFSDILVDQGGGPIFSFLAPVQGAIAEGAPVPTSDEELRSLFQESLEQLPEEQAGFVTGLLPADSDIAGPTSGSGLLIIFTSGAESTEVFDQFVDDSSAAAAEISAIDLPAGFTAEAFSFELLFADQDEFTAEIGRLFGTAFLIIMVVLAMVFLVKPRRSVARYALVVGLAAVIVSIVLVVLPTLAIILDSVFPDALKDWNSNTLFLASAILLLAVFLVWSAQRIHILVPIWLLAAWHRDATSGLQRHDDGLVSLARVLAPIRIIGWTGRGAGWIGRRMAWAAALDDLLSFRNPLASRGLRRTAADTLLTLMTIFFAISWMNGVGYLLFEDASPMAQILPILLIGLGVDYSIHVTSRYREEVSAGASIDESISRAIRTVGIALVLATVTTAVGFLTNLFNAIPALREFGALAAIGIFASFLLMLTFVPAVREILDRRGARVETFEPDRLIGGEQRALGRLIGSTSGIAKRAAVGATIVALILGGLGAWGTTNLETKFSFLDFIPTTSPLRTTFETLLNDFGGGFGENTQVLIEGDVATAEAWNEMVAANTNLTDTTNVVTFAGNPAGSSPVAAIGQLASQESPNFVPEVDMALQAAGVDQDTFMLPAGADVASVYDAAFAAAPQAVAGVLHPSGSGYDAALFDFTTQAGEAGASQLRVDVLDDFSSVNGLGLSAVATSDEIINDVIITTLRDSQLSSLLLTLIAALTLLAVNFWFEARRPMLGVITTIPVILVVLWSFGLMTLFGIPFGPVTATISALAVGIGIPYMIHITHRFLEDRERASSVEDAVELTLANTGGALAGSALTTVAGFGILVTSTTIPFRQFGFVTAYTILLAMLAAVLVLPSMLVLWDRWHARRDLRTSATSGSSAT